jgi:hypothetical protein
MAKRLSRTERINTLYTEILTMSNELFWHVHRHVIPAALSLLPGKMDSIQARAMLLAIGLQESEFNARVQGGHGTVRGTGPAHGFWQFERKGGVIEVLTDLRDLAEPICRELLYTPTSAVVHEAISDNDTLACVFARLLLWKDLRSMPESDDPKKGWQIYVDRWKPGAPRPKDWPVNFKLAWETARE